jgi:serine/threonine protein kinase
VVDRMQGLTLGNRYTVLSLLGRGGFGDVYLGRDIRSGTSVAIKVLQAQVATDEAQVRQFFREARLAQSLDHPSIVRVIDAGREDGACYLAMEYVRGMTLGELLVRHGPCSIDDVIRFGCQTLEALQVAHAAGVVHRDIKPHNLMLTTRGRIKIMDFGTAREFATPAGTLTNLRVGTPQYMAPEQILGRPVGPAADLYALGVTLYELLTGQAPFDGGSCPRTLDLHLRAPPPNVTNLRRDASMQLDGVLRRAMGKDPGRRFGSADQMRSALARCGPASPGGARGGVSPGWLAGIAVVATLVSLCLASAPPPVEDVGSSTTHLEAFQPH